MERTKVTRWRYLEETIPAGGGRHSPPREDLDLAARVTSMSVGLTRLDTRSPWTLPPVHKDLDHILGFGCSEPLAQKLKQLRSTSSHDHEQSGHRRAFQIQRHRCLRGLDGERLEGERRLG